MILAILASLPQLKSSNTSYTPIRTSEDSTNMYELQNFHLRLLRRSTTGKVRSLTWVEEFTLCFKYNTVGRYTKSCNMYLLIASESCAKVSLRVYKEAKLVNWSPLNPSSKANTFVGADAIASFSGLRSAEVLTIPTWLKLRI